MEPELAGGGGRNRGKEREGGTVSFSQLFLSFVPKKEGIELQIIPTSFLNALRE